VQRGHFIADYDDSIFRYLQLSLDNFEGPQVSSLILRYLQLWPGSQYTARYLQVTMPRQIYSNISRLCWFAPRNRHPSTPRAVSKLTSYLTGLRIYRWPPENTRLQRPKIHDPSTYTTEWHMMNLWCEWRLCILTTTHSSHDRAHQVVSKVSEGLKRLLTVFRHCIHNWWLMINEVILGRKTGSSTAEPSNRSPIADIGVCSCPGLNQNFQLRRLAVPWLLATL
jgi:hypothetical protein